MQTPHPRPNNGRREPTTANDPTQEAVFALLGDPSTHGGCAVRRYDTHASAVFLTPDRAFKVKRAVRFPFLDYFHARQTQGGMRRRACYQSPVRASPLSPASGDHP
jgi:hypothetical protein